MTRALRISGNLWPAHIKPKDDELVSSWLTRLALAHGLNAVEFSSIVWPNKPIFRDNMYGISDSEILETLARRTAIPSETAQAMLLNAYAGSLYTTNKIAKLDGRSLFEDRPWVMPVDPGLKTKQFGLQFCPQCLQEDEDPYFRRRWRLAFITLCETHGELLHDRCPKCGERVNLEARSLAIKIKLQRGALAYCFHCNYDLRNTRHTEAQSIVTHDEIDFQRFLLNVLNRGWVQLPGSGLVYSHLYFEVLHKLLRMLSVGFCKTLYRESICKYFDIPNLEISLQHSHRYIESLNVSERRALLGMVSLLLKGWPDGFITFCKASQSVWYGESLEYLDGSIKWSGPLFEYMEDIPFWYWKVVSDHLLIRMYRQRKPYLSFRGETTRSIDEYREHRKAGDCKLEKMLSNISMEDWAPVCSDMVNDQPVESEVDYYFLRVHEYWPRGFVGEFEIVWELEHTK